MTLIPPPKAMSDDELRSAVRAWLKDNWRGLPVSQDQWTSSPERRA